MVQITAIEGNTQWLDGGAMFGNAPRVMWEKWVQVDPLHRIQLSCRSLLIQDGSLTILCEVGIGAFFPPKLAQRYGVQSCDHKLLMNLKNLGVKEEDVDYVILSHLHFDHAGGLLPPYEERIHSGDRLYFPNARYVVSKAAWERALSPHPRDQASFIPELSELLAASGRMILLEDQGTLSGVNGFSFLSSHGHTPGQLHTVYRGKKRSVVFAGDLVPGVPWIHVPITMGYDRFGELVVDEKRRLYERILKEDSLLFFTHDSQFAMAGIMQDEKGKFLAKEGDLWTPDHVQKWEL